jgi:hypothetical protein
MVAELKVVASSFQTKNIDGNGNIDQYCADSPVKITDKHLNSVNVSVGSILKDVRRLNSIEDPQIEKFIILVIPRYEVETKNEKLEAALFAISLSNQYWEGNFRDHDFVVRLWLLDK